MVHQPQSPPLPLGATAPNFTLQGTDGKEYALPRHRGAKGTLVAFACNHCPYVKAYDARIAALAGEFGPKGIAWFVINANNAKDYPDDNFEKMKEKAETLHLLYPYLRDETQRVALDFGAGCTPEFFLFDAHLTLVYTGRLDDNMESPEAVREHYLRDACQAVLAGKAPRTEKTHPIGCSIKWTR